MVRRFGQITAVDGLDLVVPPGVCFGLLGPNGAGKSTTMRMLTAQTLADEGTIEVLGYSLPRESKQARMAMGVVPQLDEPTVGLDPQVRQELWSLIDGLRADGVTVLMSTHYIEEAERLADTVAVMSAGKIIASGTPSQLVTTHAGREVLEVYGPPAELAQLEAQATERGWPYRRSGPAVALLEAERLNGDAPEGVRRAANLEDAFVALTGREIE